MRVMNQAKTKASIKSETSVPNQKQPQNPASPLHKLYLRQRKKYQPKPTTSALLKTFADDDYKQIAVLIQTWLKTK